jgi:hypothetical protein
LVLDGIVADSCGRFFYGLTSMIGALAVIVTPMW